VPDGLGCLGDPEPLLQCGRDPLDRLPALGPRAGIALPHRRPALPDLDAPLPAEDDPAEDDEGPSTASTSPSEQGEVHGFLGPNGSGKSTTIRVLLGLLRADGGTSSCSAATRGRDVIALHRRLAYVPGDVSLWPGLSGGQAIDLLGNLRGGLDRARRDRLIERFELDPTKRGRQYSKGNRQKVAIVAALSSDAELLILDEPTSGLDPLMEAVFQDEIAAVKDEGRTVLLSSHILTEVEALADRVSIIRCASTPAPTSTRSPTVTSPSVTSPG
jgi:ABC-type Na+ transport system ATPase subunit NatA